MNQIETVARAAAWLRECHDWLLANDYDMECPMEADPLDLAEELEAIAAMPVQAEPVAWILTHPQYGIPELHFERRMGDAYIGWTETPLYAHPTPPAGGSDAE